MADDYSAIADPVEAAPADDYSSIATPLEHVEKTQDFSAIAEPLKQNKTTGQWEVPKEFRNEALAIPAKQFANASPWERLKMILSNPIEKYNASVDQGFKGPVEIPRIEAQGSGDAAQIGAGAANVATGAASGLISAPVAASLLNPAVAAGTAIYSAPRFIAGGVSDLVGDQKTNQADFNSLLNAKEQGFGGPSEEVIQTTPKQSTQQKAEKLIGGALQLAGGVGALAHAVPRAMHEIAKPKPSSVLSDIENVTTKQTPIEANAGANAIAMKPIEPVSMEQITTDKVAPVPIEPTENTSATQRALSRDSKALMLPEPTPVAEKPAAASESAPVDIGPRDATVSTGTGVPTEVEAKMLEDWKKSIEEETGKKLISRNDKANYEAYQENLPKFEEARLKYQDDPTNPKLEEDFLNAWKKNEELKNKNGGWAPEPPKPYVKTLLEPDNFEKEWKKEGAYGGSENQVFFKDGVAYKRNYDPMAKEVLPIYKTVEAYKEYIDLHNSLFPDTKIKFEGMSDTPNGPAPVTSQSEVNGKKATVAEIKSYMEDMDFVPNGKGKFINADTGIQLEDMRGENVLKDKQGNIRVIDPTIKRVGADMTLEKPPVAKEVPAQAQASQGVGQEVRSGIAEPAAPRQEAQAIPVAAQPPTPPVPPGQVPAPAPSFNNPLPDNGWTPFISKSRIGQFIKEKIGTTVGNIRAISPEVAGSLIERGFKINEFKFDWHNSSKDYGTFARKALKPEAFTELDRLLQSGLHEEAKAFIKGSKHEAELTQHIASFKKTLDAIRRAEINAGREVGLLDNYWIRQVADYEGLRNELGKDPSHAYEKALKAEKVAKKRALTLEEEAAVANKVISTSFSGHGKPGFLNERTIGEINKNWFKYYEPSDVAMDNRINRAAKDVVNRAYLGKFEPEGLPHPASGQIGAIEGSLGEIINSHLQSGSLTPEGSRIVVKNLQDFLRSESDFNETSSSLANKIRKAQTYGYLSDLSSAIPQFGDFFISAQRNGFLDAAKGFVNRPVKLQDIKLHQGNPETAIFAKKNREGFVGKVFRKAVETSIGIADGFNKGGSLNTTFHEAARDMNNPKSDTYKRLDSKWKERFPKRWPEIKKDLQSPNFANGKLTPNTEFFLYSELADIQPLSGESLAQGFHQSGPFGKIIYGLRSFAIKQLDVMREIGYEKMRSNDPVTRSEGRKNLVTYALIVGIGQQFLSSYLRDKLFSRQSDTSEYALSGLMQLVGLNRYLIYRSGDVGLGTAALETLVPGVGILNDLGQSSGVELKYLTGQRSEKTGLKTVPTQLDALSKMNAIKYVPFIGREIDAYLGPGAAREKKKSEDKAKGKLPKTTLQQIGEAIIPPDTKS